MDKSYCYIFTKEALAQDLRRIGAPERKIAESLDLTWVAACDGKKIFFDESKCGRIGNFRIFIDWCEKVEDC